MSETHTQSEALAALGFGPAWSAGDFLSATMATCLKCGATVRIMPSTTPEVEQPPVVHYMWHLAVSR